MSCKDAQYCPECHGEGQKLMSASSVIFKGSGFYSTDYRDSGYLEAKKKDSESSSSDTNTKPDSKSESKPSEKKEKSDSSVSSSAKPESPVPAAA
jgi:predicted nucleic acid-binding Zn ribbon protein